MKTVTIPIPTGGYWTLEAFNALPDDLGVKLELVDGELRVNASPTPRHNLIEFNLLSHFREQIPPAWHAIFEVDVVLNADPVTPTEVIPDLVVYLADYDESTRPMPASAVLLVVEVVSPHSKRKDRVEYPERYAEAGIPYYWRVETPATSPDLRIFTYTLQDGAYAPQGEFADDLVLEEPFPIRFPVASLLD